jgi:Tol biopolymer transport system component
MKKMNDQNWVRPLLFSLVTAFTVLLSACVDASSLAESMLSDQVNMVLPTTPTAAPPPTVQPLVATPTPTPGIQAESLPIVFTSNRGAAETTDIFQINPDGSGLIRLTDDLANDRDPVWSPDRDTIAFTSDRSGKEQIYLLSTTDYSFSRLTNHEQGAVSPTWSPDGLTIAFVEPGDENQTLYFIDVLSGQLETEFDVGLSGVANPAWSTVGDVIAFTAVNSAEKEDRDIFAITIGQEIIVNLTNHPSNDDHAAWTHDGARIAFQTNRDGNNDIYIMNANGSLQTPITVDRADDIEPDWSGDGRQIVFSSNRDGAYQLHIISENGSEPTVVAPVLADDRQANWSEPPKPVGDVILYSSSTLAADPNLFTIDLPDLTKRQLASLEGTDSAPAWSPDASKIAFASDASGEFEIYVINSDGSGEAQRLTDSTGKSMHPTWSPDGEKIAFESNRTKSWDIWVMNADGSNDRNLTIDNRANYGNPAWSPNGNEIALSSNRSGSYDIYVMNADASGEIEQLTDLERDAFHPSWSPDGMTITFRANSGEERRWQIYAMLRSGERLNPLFSSIWNDDMPAWSPDSNRIAFVSDRGSQSRRFSQGVYSVFTYDIHSGKITAISMDVNENAQYPVWKPHPTPSGPTIHSEPE